MLARTQKVVAGILSTLYKPEYVKTKIVMLGAYLMRKRIFKFADGILNLLRYDKLSLIYIRP